METKTVMVEDLSWLDSSKAEIDADVLCMALEEVGKFKDLTYYGIAVKAVEFLNKRGYTIEKIIANESL